MFFFNLQGATYDKELEKDLILKSECAMKKDNSLKIII